MRTALNIQVNKTRFTEDKFISIIILNYLADTQTIVRVL